jgi:hypothetical protein
MCFWHGHSPCERSRHTNLEDEPSKTPRRQTGSQLRDPRHSRRQGVKMETREKTFTIRFSLTADIPDALWEDDEFEEDSWLDEWEGAIKPGLIRALFSHVRSFPNWEAHIRNRGISPLDEIEIALQRSFGPPPKARDSGVQ